VVGRDGNPEDNNEKVCEVPEARREIEMGKLQEFMQKHESGAVDNTAGFSDERPQFQF
jgi:hypothetical protein